jgi:aldose 1-epimerase
MAAEATDADVRVFGTLPSGEQVRVIHLECGEVQAQILTFGATLLSVKCPSRSSSVREELTVNARTLDEFLEREATTYAGSTVGRVANRIAGGEFPFQGRSVVLAKNNGANHLHGGEVGFDKVSGACAVWVGA